METFALCLGSAIIGFLFYGLLDNKSKLNDEFASLTLMIGLLNDLQKAFKMRQSIRFKITIKGIIEIEIENFVQIHDMRSWKNEIRAMLEEYSNLLLRKGQPRAFLLDEDNCDSLSARIVSKKI